MRILEGQDNVRSRARLRFLLDPAQLKESDTSVEIVFDSAAAESFRGHNPIPARLRTSPRAVNPSVEEA